MIDDYTMTKLARERVAHPTLHAAQRELRRCEARRVRARRRFGRSIAQGLGDGLAPCELTAELRTLLRAKQAA